MALGLYDRVQETTATTGTGTITLGGAIAGYQSFAVVGNGNTTYYTILNGSAWEVGLGTYSTTGPTLARTTILSNSNGDTSPITLSGASTVWVDYPAGKAVWQGGPLGTPLTGTLTNATGLPISTGVSGLGTNVATALGNTLNGASGLVSKDTNSNISANNILFGYTAVTAAAGTTVLTAGSAYYQRLSGSTTQTFQLPDATTCVLGQAWVFDNDSSGTLTIVDNASGAVDTIPSGGYGYIFAESISTSAGSWGKYALLPSTYDFNNASANFGNATISNAVWNGTTIAYNYGGTGLTTFTAANNALYSTSASALTAGTLPVAAGGTGATTLTLNGVVYGNGTSAAGITAAGTTGQVLIATTSGAPSWGSVPSTAAVTSFTAGTTGFTPSSATTGAVTLAGTLNVANGGTGVTTSTGSGSVVLSTSPTLVSPALGTPSALVGTNITGTASGLSIGGNAVTATTATTANALNTSNSYTTSGSYTSTKATQGSGAASAFYANGGDITAARTTTTGVIYLGSDGNHYVYYDGTNYIMPNGSVIASGVTLTGNTGTVTSVAGTGTVNGITLTGTVTTSGSLTLGGTLSGVSLTTQVSGTLPIANGGNNSTATPTAGSVHYGTGTAWAATAAGTSGQYLQSAGSGTPTWVTVNIPYAVDYLVVAGGGSGGGRNVGGGGGAGGYIATSGIVAAGTAYTVTVGGGGAGVGPSDGLKGNTGSASSFNNTIASGGGGGSFGVPPNSGGSALDGLSGGSGGGGGGVDNAPAGSGGSGTSGQGYSGGAGNTGANGGGGGGAGAVGGSASGSAAGAGGTGLNWQSLGTYYAGGGGGGANSNRGAGGTGGGGQGGAGNPGSGQASGTANTGGGGGGNGGFGTTGTSGSGGSGVVIIRYPGSQKGTGGTVTSAGGYTYHTFTSSGTYTG